ncbi:hypothetical protein WK95_05870 [Burkholderia ubonensis]|nr:hypothetical protein WK95_05870 [Burkholderia ubonensis]
MCIMGTFTVSGVGQIALLQTSRCMTLTSFDIERPPGPIRFLFVRPALCHPASFRLSVSRETLAFG